MGIYISSLSKIFPFTSMIVIWLNINKFLKISIITSVIMFIVNKSSRGVAYIDITLKMMISKSCMPSCDIPFIIIYLIVFYHHWPLDVVRSFVRVELFYSFEFVWRVVSKIIIKTPFPVFKIVIDSILIFIKRPPLVLEISLIFCLYRSHKQIPNKVIHRIKISESLSTSIFKSLIIWHFRLPRVIVKPLTSIHHFSIK